MPQTQLSMQKYGADGSTFICDGSSVMLHASPADAAVYQWSLNGAAISGATESNYSATEGGDYSVTVTNATGCSDFSSVLSVSISTSPIAMITPDGNVNVCQGNGQLFSANTGIGFTYQWLKNGTAISGATNDSYAAISPGDYSVVISNLSSCTTISNISTLIVNANPAAVITPDGSTTFCDGSSVNLVGTTGNGFSYQWALNGGNINGATDGNYAASQSGDYS